MAINNVFLLHHTGTGASAEPQLLCNKYGYTLWRLDPKKQLPKSGDNFKSLDEALEDPRFKGWNWVFFDEKASDSLDKFVHQNKISTVYVFGSDTDGWDRSLDALPGTLVRIPPDGAHTQAFCAAAVINHRYYQVDVK